MEFRTGRVAVPLDADLRPFAKTFGQLMAATAVISALALVSGTSSLYMSGLFAGTFVTSAVIALGQFRSVRFKTQHLEEDLDFWRAHWSRVRPRTYWVSMVGIAVGAVVLMAGIALARPWLIGFPQAPLLAFIVVVVAFHGRLHPR